MSGGPHSRRGAPEKAQPGAARDHSRGNRQGRAVAAARTAASWATLPLRLALRLALLIAAGAERVLRGPAVAVGGRLGKASRSVSASLTPTRAAGLVALFAFGALVASQFIDFRGVAIGQDPYAGSGTAVPVTATESAWNVHGPALGLLGLAALLGALGSLRSSGAASSKRRRRGRRAALAGSAAAVLGLGIALGVDLPHALDLEDAGTSYAGADARLLSGFHAQVAACATLAVIALAPLLWNRDADRKAG